MADNKLTAGTQWIIDTVYPKYHEFFPLLEMHDTKDEYSSETVAFGAKQYPIWAHENLAQLVKHKQYQNFTAHTAWDEAAGNLLVWTEEKLKEHEITHKVCPIISWLIDYDLHGWQSMHTHDPKCISQIIYMDDTPHITIDSPAKEAGYGAMYAVIADTNKAIYKSFVSRPGRTLLMTGDIFHGVYPVKSVPRRSIIIDYLITP